MKGANQVNIQSIQLASLQAQNSTSNVQSKNNSSFQAALEQASLKTGNNQLEQYFQEASDTYGVPMALLKAVAKAESNFNQNVVSSAGAVGVMQLMPETAKDLGVQNIYDTRQNILGGAKELSQLLKRYDGDLTLTLAGYNAGIGNVQKYGGVPPFKETQNYIKKVTAYLGESIEIPNTAQVGVASEVSSESTSLVEELSTALTESTSSLSQQELIQFYVESMKYQVQSSFYSTISLDDEEL